MLIQNMWDSMKKSDTHSRVRQTANRTLTDSSLVVIDFFPPVHVAMLCPCRGLRSQTDVTSTRHARMLWMQEWSEDHRCFQRKQVNNQKFNKKNKKRKRKKKNKYTKLFIQWNFQKETNQKYKNNKRHKNQIINKINEIYDEGFKSTVKIFKSRNKKAKEPKAAEREASRDGWNITHFPHSLHPLSSLSPLSLSLLSVCRSVSLSLSICADWVFALERKENVSPRMAVGTKGSVIRMRQQQTDRQAGRGRHRYRDIGRQLDEQVEREAKR